MSGTAQVFSGTEHTPARRIGPISKKDPRSSSLHSKENDAVVVCQDNLVFMRSLPDASMKLIVTSPPYNLGKEYETKSSLDDCLGAQQETIQEAVRLLHPSGSICWQTGNYVDDGEVFPLDILLYPIFKKAGLQLRNRIIWTFGHGLHCQKRLALDGAS